MVFRNVKLDTGLPDNFFLITNLYHVGLFYLNAYVLYPRFFNRRRWWAYILLIIAIVILSFRIKLFFVTLINPAFALNEMNARLIFFPPVPFLIASFIFSFIRSRIRREREEKERRAERLASELKFLRSQVSPHFLFNVLTNLVSLARQKSDLLEPTLIKLSDLMRYMLYESNSDKFPLSSEIASLENYVELQRLRFGDDVKINMDISADNPDCYIEPMLLIPFVENAFKHGIGLLKDPFIDIKLEAKDKRLSYAVINNYNKDNLSKDKNSGIGLVNVENRLKLLYGKNYSLNIKNDGEIYSIQLNLDLQC
jgi:LytS/YehU family sensor histidine kinase